MTETTEQPTPQHLWHQGQAWSKESAATALAAFDADKDKVAAALAGDVSKQQERRDLWMLARGMTPGAVPTMPSDSTGVAEQMTEREEQIQEGPPWHLAATYSHERPNEI
jgi:anti-sigma-K factor RskA